MEGVDTVPETAWVQVKDRTTGKKNKADPAFRTVQPF